MDSTAWESEEETRRSAEKRSRLEERIEDEIRRALFERAWDYAEEALGVSGAVTLFVERIQLIASDQWEPRRRPIPPRVRTTVFRRDGYVCVDCGEEDVYKLTVDHRIPVALGGTNAPDNLRTLCRSCNSSKGARL